MGHKLAPHFVQTRKDDPAVVIEIVVEVVVGGDIQTHEGMEVHELSQSTDAVTELIDQA